MRFLLFALTATIAGSTPALAAPAPAAPAPAAAEMPADEDIQQRLDALVKRGVAKGLVLGILRADGSRDYFTAGSAGEGKLPLGPHSAFELGSITKTFTGALLADAVRRGEVKLDDPVARHLPDGVRVPGRGGKQITLLDLATHRSGLPRMPVDWNPANDLDPYADYDKAKLFATIGKYGPTRDIGTPEYSNLGMALLGVALAHAAGVAEFQTLVEQRILRPLNLSETAYGMTPALEEKMTTGHDKDGKPVPHWNIAAFSGAAGINSTAADMLTYLDAYLGPVQSPIEQSMRAAIEPRRPINDDGWKIGLGWQVLALNGHRLAVHGGSTGGYGTWAAIDPEAGTGIVVLANTDDFEGGFVMRMLAGVPKRVEVALPPETLPAYAGRYRLGETMLTITADGGTLYGAAGNDEKVALLAEGPDNFFSKRTETEIDFVRDSGGRVRALVLRKNGRTSPEAVRVE